MLYWLTSKRGRKLFFNIKFNNYEKNYFFFITRLVFRGGHTLYSQLVITIPENTTVVWPAAGIGPDDLISKIIVEGTLIVPEDQTITFLDYGSILLYGNMELYGVLTAHSYWTGIHMLGELQDLPSAPFGGSFYGDGGRIEKAKVGIYGRGEDILGGKVGIGKIDCTNMIFRDNTVSILMYRYVLFAPWTDSSDPGPVYNGEVESDIITLDNCVFEYSKNYVDYPGFFFSRRHIALLGVKGYPPEYSVKISNCTFRNYNVTNTVGIYAYGSKFIADNCKFIKLSKGVEAFGYNFIIPIIGGTGYAGSPYTIEKSSFHSCEIGIQNTLNEAFTIEDNYFRVGRTKLSALNAFVGIFTGGATRGFTIQNNRFYGWGTKVEVPSYGTYFKDIGSNNMNVINGNTFLRLSYGNVAENKNADEHGGLYYACNHMVGDHGIDFSALSEEDLAIRKDQGISVGVFGWLPPMNKFSWDGIDFYADNMQNYRYYVPSTVPDPSLRVIPQTYVGVDLLNAQLVNNACLDFLYYKSKFKYFNNLAEVEKQQYRQDYFANSSAFESKNQVYKSTSSLNEKDGARQAMTYHRQKMDESAYMMYNNAVTTNEPRDSVRLWLQRSKRPASDYLLTVDYMKTHQFNSAKKVLEKMPQKYAFSATEMEDYDRMVNIYEAQMESSDSLSESMRRMLEEYAEEPKGQARYLARSILTGDGCFYMPDLAEIPMPNNYADNKNEVDNLKMNVFPNPVDYNTTFDWGDFDYVGKDVAIEITNQTGGLVEIVHPTGGNYYMEWTTEGISGSLLYYRLLLDGTEVDAGQIILNK